MRALARAGGRSLRAPPVFGGTCRVFGAFDGCTSRTSEWVAFRAIHPLRFHVFLIQVEGLYCLTCSFHAFSAAACWRARRVAGCSLFIKRKRKRKDEKIGTEFFSFILENRLNTQFFVEQAAVAEFCRNVGKLQTIAESFW